MKTVLVTGAAQGLGLTAAILLSQREYRVILVDIQSVEAQVRRIRERGRVFPAMSRQRNLFRNWPRISVTNTAQSTDS
jgi:NAD(P)-dependent dehydrogenase (short-subunit alcohol dehydrogenase family)